LPVAPVTRMTPLEGMSRHLAWCAQRGMNPLLDGSIFKLIGGDARPSRFEKQTADW
jgi:hypothetical protein